MPDLYEPGVYREQVPASEDPALSAGVAPFLFFDRNDLARSDIFERLVSFLTDPTHSRPLTPETTQSCQPSAYA